MSNPRSGFDTTVEDKLKSVDKLDDLTVQFTYLSANEAHALDPERYKDQGNEPVVDPLYFFGLYDAPAIYRATSCARSSATIRATVGR